MAPIIGYYLTALLIENTFLINCLTLNVSTGDRVAYKTPNISFVTGGQA